jgi:hypothetical protein
MSALLSCTYRTEEQTAETGMFGFLGLDPIHWICIALPPIIAVVLIVTIGRRKGGGGKQ